MTIFDSIKYPISNRPTGDELAAIPYKIFQQWKHDNGLNKWLGPREMAEAITGQLTKTPQEEDLYIKGLNDIIIDLRKRISEYEDDNI